MATLSKFLDEAISKKLHPPARCTLTKGRMDHDASPLNFLVAGFFCQKTSFVARGRNNVMAKVEMWGCCMVEYLRRG